MCGGEQTVIGSIHLPVFVRLRACDIQSVLAINDMLFNVAARW